MDHLDLRAQVESLLVEFAYRVDRGEAESVADLFTPDGEYTWQGHGSSAGRDAIRAAYRTRADLGPRTARHLFTNVRVEPIDAAEIRVTSIMLLFADDGPPPRPAITLLVADVDDLLVNHGGRWLLKSRQLKDIFIDPKRTPVLPLEKRGP